LAAVEATFNVYGERGSVDVLGWHSPTRSLLIGEIKSVVADAQGTLAPLDRKVRHGARIGQDRDWNPDSISSALVVRDGSTNRRRIADLGSTFEARRSPHAGAGSCARSRVIRELGTASKRSRIGRTPRLTLKRPSAMLRRL